MGLLEVCGLETGTKPWLGDGRGDGGDGAVFRLLNNTVTRFGERWGQSQVTMGLSKVWIGARTGNTSSPQGKPATIAPSAIYPTIRLDQTTRIHGPIRGPDGSCFWSELSRPQVHGYDMLGVAFLGPLKFVSIADEKVARVFEAPRGFVDLVEQLGIAVFTEEQAGPILVDGEFS